MVCQILSVEFGITSIEWPGKLSIPAIFLSILQH